MTTAKFRALARGTGLYVTFLIGYPFIFFIILPSAGLQLLPVLISNIGVTWFQFFYDFYILGALITFFLLIVVPVKRAHN